MDKAELEELKFKLEDPQERLNNKDLYILYYRCRELLQYIDFAIVTPYASISKEYINTIIQEGRATFTEEEVAIITPVIEETLLLLTLLGYVENVNNYPLITEQGKNILKEK